MTKLSIKICGITCRRNLKSFIDLPFNFIGLNFVERSKRRIKKDKAKKIIQSLPKRIIPVLIFEDENTETVLRLLKELNVNYIQLHGKESVKYCADLKMKNKRIKIIKVFPSTIDTLKELAGYKKYVDYYLIDSSDSNGKMGGTGKKANWDMAKKIVQQSHKLKKKVFLAGGLNPENIKEAIKKVNPDFLDLNSGVENNPGKKDKNKILSLVATLYKHC